MCKSEPQTVEAEPVAPTEETGIQVAEPVTTNGLLQMAIDKDLDVEKLRMLMDLKDRDDAKIAHRAFVVAMNAFKENAPDIIKDKKNEQYGSMYASIEALVNPAATEMSKYGLSHRWEYPERTDSSIAVTCILTHVEGHSERVTLCGPPDSSGAKNDLQKIRSTNTYLKVTTFEAVTGLASSGGNLNDDGNGASDLITEEEAVDFALRLDKIGGDLKKFLANFKVERLEDIPRSQYTKADRMIAAKETV